MAPIQGAPFCLQEKHDISDYYTDVKLEAMQITLCWILCFLSFVSTFTGQKHTYPPPWESIGYVLETY